MENVTNAANIVKDAFITAVKNKPLAVVCFAAGVTGLVLLKIKKNEKKNAATK